MYLYICFLWCINVEHQIPSKLQKPIHKDSQITRISSSHTSWVIYPWHLATLQVAKDQYLLDVLNVAPFHLWSKSGESQLYIWSSVQHAAWWKFLTWNFNEFYPSPGVLLRTSWNSWKSGTFQSSIRWDGLPYVQLAWDSSPIHRRKSLGTAMQFEALAKKGIQSGR